MKINNSIYALLIPLVIICVAVVILVVRKNSGEERVVLGMFETTTVNVSSEIPGRVDQIFVNLGEKVEKGQLLATLEPSIMNAKLDQAEGIRIAANSLLKRTKEGTRKEEITAALNSYQMAKSQFEFAEKTHNRFQNLYLDSIISKQEMDEVSFKYNAAKNEMEAAMAIYELAKNGATTTDIEIIAGEADVADAILMEAQAYYEQLEIVSPVDGEISNKLSEPGEVMGAGYPLLTVMIPEDIYVLANVREDLLASFKIGKVLKGKVPGLNGENFEFKVSYMAVMADFATWVPTRDKGEFDLKTFQVRLIPVEKIDGLRPGMTVQLSY